MVKGGGGNHNTTDHRPHNHIKQKQLFNPLLVGKLIRLNDSLVDPLLLILWKTFLRNPEKI